MNVSKIKPCILALALSSTTLVHAQEEQDQPFFPAWEWGIALGTLNIDSESAEEQLIGDSADFVISFTADYSTKNWLTTLGFDWVSYDDKAGFTVRTEDQFGREDDSSSDASGILVYGAFGPQWRFGEEQKTTAFVQAGYSAMFASDRGIDNCSNCPSQDIDIDGGLYARAGIMQKVSDTFGIGLSATQYLSSDDLENGISFTMKWTPNS
jgi:hypothetical protein